MCVAPAPVAIDAVVFELRIPAERDMGIGIAQRRVLALRNVMLDDGGAGPRGRFDDDARVGDIVRRRRRSRRAG